MEAEYIKQILNLTIIVKELDDKLHRLLEAHYKLEAIVRRLEFHGGAREIEQDRRLAELEKSNLVFGGKQ